MSRFARIVILFLVILIILFRQGILLHVVLREISLQSTDPSLISLFPDKWSPSNGKGKPFEDQDCPFRASPLYRSIYAYPSPGDDEWEGDILSASNVTSWPWIEIDRRIREAAQVHYDPSSQAVQYTTELLVRDIILHPKSCLRTKDPAKAKLFYVPYLPSVEYHNGSLTLGDYKTSPFGQALMDATAGDYRAWESTFGLTSEYWQRRNGSDHILVFSEPLHGLWHPKSRRGSFHFIHSQKQLTPPIVISVELSRTFVEKYPYCARKNILMPYPNTDGKWFNGYYDQEAERLYQEITVGKSPAALSAEKEIARQTFPSGRNYPRPLAQFYKGGNHGTCRILRLAMQRDFLCTNSSAVLEEQKRTNDALDNYMLAYRQSTFCPCPGGDSPSAKRMFDALHAGCIPIILSHDYVWPLTTEFDGTNGTNLLLRPQDFAIRLKAQDYDEASFHPNCDLANSSSFTIQNYIESLSAAEIARLRVGVEKAANVYAYYKRRTDLPDNPLQAGVLPDGGAAHALVAALAERAEGVLWPACQEELENGSAQPDVPNAWQFAC